MVVSIHQPMYLPWLAFFDKLLRSDLFVLLDSVQFERNSFINRNYVKSAGGKTTLLTVPVSLKGHLQGTIATTAIADQRFASRHLKTIDQAYRRAPRHAELMPQLEQLYAVEHETIGQLNEAHLRFWLRQLEVERPLVRSSELAVDGAAGSELVLAVCRAVGADRYISGPLGRRYLDELAFARAGIKVDYQAYRHPVYPQLHGEFAAGLGVVDYALMGGSAAGILAAAAAA